MNNLLDRFSKQTVLKLLKSFSNGSLQLVLEDGEQLSIGHQFSTVRADLQIRDHRFYRHCLLYGDIGFGEAYMQGWWTSDHLTALLRYLILNLRQIPGMSGSSRHGIWNLFKFLNRFSHLLRRNNRSNARRNIREHYDLSNEFFALFLDRGLTYSSAFYAPQANTLEMAQAEKYRRLAEKMGLRAGHQVLEIGCGWGGFALYAAGSLGCRVHGITLSRKQLEIASQRVAHAHLQDQVTLEYRDYRDVQGQYDAIVSIEMLEAVGFEYLPAYFAQCHRLLKPTGVLGLQVIISPDSRTADARRNVDWIQKHIFPGGYLPSIAAINQAVNATGDLYLQHLENFGLHYARTLADWRKLFLARQDAVRALGFDDVFLRKWEYYLCYCEAAFAMRNINVTQLVYTRPNNTTFALPEEEASRNMLPLTVAA